jgi:hypothetical protein
MYSGQPTKRTAMNAPVPSELLLRRDRGIPDQPTGSTADQRYVWEGKFGPILIEVRGGSTYVNGALVEPVVEDPGPT